MTKLTFSQYLTESSIKVPPSTFKDAMRIVLGAYVSALAYYIRLDDEGVPPRGYAEAVRALESEYGSLSLVSFDTQSKWMRGTVTFDTVTLPAQYRKNIRSRKLSLIVWAGFDGSGTTDGNSGEYMRKSRGRASEIRIDLRSVGNLESASYNASNIPRHARKLKGLVMHELQHMVQDVALSKLHKDQMMDDDEFEEAQVGNGGQGLDRYYNSQEEFIPQISSASHDLIADLPPDATKADVKQAIISIVNPSSEDVIPFFASLARQSRPKWKKAVKELHRLVLSELKPAA